MDYPQHIFIFNPEHDLALAFGGENYTSPPLAARLRHDLQMIPAWMAEDACSGVLSRNRAEDSTWLQSIATRYGINVAAVEKKHLWRAASFSPWGWDLNMRRRLVAARVDASLLPTREQIADIRCLSHRSISIEIMRRLATILHRDFSPLPLEAHTLGEIQDFAMAYPRAFVKAPWSSSGRGIFRALDSNATEFVRWCSGILQRQGAVMCECALRGLLDFAMEFHCSEGKSSFVGYSVFTNDRHNSFDTAVVASTDRLEDMIAGKLQDRRLLLDIRDALSVVLDELVAPRYSGYLGVDMLVHEDAGRVDVCPCIELNLRCTMGIITGIIGNRFVHPSSQGTFRVEYHKDAITPGYIDLLEEGAPPLVVNDGKIISGLQLLAPLYPDSRYCAYMTIVPR